MLIYPYVRYSMIRRSLLFVAIAFIFFSCGIDDIVYLEPPKLIHSPSGHPHNDAQKYFEFKTSDVENLTASVGSVFKGFEVYYRIYESETDCENVIKNMVKYTETNPVNSVNYLFSSHNYKLLSHSNHSYQNKPIIKASTTSPPNDRLVKFRLEDVDSFPSDFTVAGSKAGNTKRQNGEDFTAAKRGDYDVQSSSNPSDDSFYVAVFASAYGYDLSFKPIYSELVSLGYVKIKKNP